VDHVTPDLADSWSSTISKVQRLLEVTIPAAGAMVCATGRIGTPVDKIAGARDTTSRSAMIQDSAQLGRDCAQKGAT
jgi:hypothetical protein